MHGIQVPVCPFLGFWFLAEELFTTSGHPGLENQFNDGEWRITFVFKRSCAPFVARNLV